jgi:hypothetical protein
MIEENSVDVGEWRTMLKKASRKHEDNKATHTSAVDHCGFLFEKMLKDWVFAQKKRLAITQPWRPRSGDEMDANTAMDDMRLPPEGRRLLRSAVTSESLSLKDGGCIPCPLSWEKVVAFHKHTKGEWAAFQQLVTQAIFSFEGDQPPRCEWYEQWQSVKPIPRPDNTPLIEAGVPESDARELRSTVDEWIGTFIEDEQEAVRYGDEFVLCASKRITGPGIRNAASALECLAAERQPFTPSSNDDGDDGGSPLRFRRY